jgi:hypothetical protein
MKILFKGYILTPVPASLDRFDISKKVIATAKIDKKDGVKKGTQYEREEEIAYGCSLESAIQKIISYSLAEKEGTTDLRGYVDAYKKEKLELEKLLKL